MADKRITDVDFSELLNIDNSESFFINQSGTLKQITNDNAWELISSSAHAKAKAEADSAIINDIRNQIAEIDMRLEFEDAINDINSQIKATNDAIAEVVSATESNSSKIDENSNKIDEKIDEYDALLDQLTGNNNDFNSTIKGILGALGGFEYVDATGERKQPYSDGNSNPTDNGDSSGDAINSGSESDGDGNASDGDGDTVVEVVYWDMDKELQQGAHFKFYKTGENTKNTPYKLIDSITLSSGLILSFASTTKFGVQLALISGGTSLYIRELHSGTIGNWKKISSADI